ncbi:MAG TPA: helix-turn-helix transcriptional regulator [Candidatus Angelobacter sp.]|nr:helix-turn-helix transcriptional regulator [Candidatus Angelobacter sp.]
MEKGYGVSLRNAYKLTRFLQITVYELWPDLKPSQPSARFDAAGLHRYSVHELRTRLKWRLHDLSEVSGVSKATLVQVENGHVPSLKNAAQIANALGVSVYQIWNLK